MSSGAAAKTPAPTKIGQLLVERGLISRSDVEQALALQGEASILFGEALLRIGALSEEHLLSALSDQLHIPILDEGTAPDSNEPISTALERIGLDWTWARSQQVRENSILD